MLRMTRRRLPSSCSWPSCSRLRPAQATRRLRSGSARALAVPHVSQSRVGAVAIDLVTGESLFSEHGNLPLVPASNEKLAVAYSALVTLGPTFRFETDVLGRGEQDGTIWRGTSSWSATATRRSPALTSRRWRRQVRGGRHPPRHARRLRRRVFLRRAPHRRRAGSRSSTSTSRPPLSALTVDRGRYSAARRAHPAAAAALLFRNALRRAGVAVAGAGVGKQRDDDVPLAVVESAPLSQIVAWMERVSDNFTAELLLKQLGASADAIGTSAAGAAVVRTALAEAGVPLAGLRDRRRLGPLLLDRLTAALAGRAPRVAWADPEVRPDAHSPRFRWPAAAARSSAECAAAGAGNVRAKTDRLASPRRCRARQSAATSSRCCRTAARLDLLGAQGPGPVRDRVSGVGSYGSGADGSVPSDATAKAPRIS